MKHCLSLLCFLTFIVNGSVVLPKETCFEIIHHAIQAAARKPYTKKNRHIHRETLQIKNIVSTLKKFKELSKNFYAATNYYIQTIISKQIFPIFRICPYKELSYSILSAIQNRFIDEYHRFHKPIVHMVQWYAFYSKLVHALRKYTMNSSIQKAVKNSLFFALKCMDRRSIRFFNQNSKNTHPQQFDPRLIFCDTKHTYSIKELPFIIPDWFRLYIQSDGNSIPKDKYPILFPAFIAYTEQDNKRIDLFIKKYREYCLQNQNQIIQILASPNNAKKLLPIKNKTIRNSLIIARFLIVMCEGPLNKKEKKIYNFLTKVSKYYWYNPF